MEIEALHKDENRAIYKNQYIKELGKLPHSCYAEKVYVKFISKTNAET